MHTLRSPAARRCHKIGVLPVFKGPESQNIQYIMSKPQTAAWRQALIFIALIFAFIEGPGLLDRLRGAPEYDAATAGPVTV
ncbi:MAG: hypothetical protein AAFU65_13465, partial [Pseudomonadota bacterium]